MKQYKGVDEESKYSWNPTEEADRAIAAIKEWEEKEAAKALREWEEMRASGKAIAKVKEAVDHPSHYGGDTVYEAIKVIEAWNLGFNLGNTVKYISRAGKKSPEKTLEDLEKALWYLTREVNTRKAAK